MPKPIRAASCGARRARHRRRKGTKVPRWAADSKCERPRRCRQKHRPLREVAQGLDRRARRGPVELRERRIRASWQCVGPPKRRRRARQLRPPVQGQSPPLQWALPQKEVSQLWGVLPTRTTLQRPLHVHFQPRALPPGLYRPGRRGQRSCESAESQRRGNAWGRHGRAPEQESSVNPRLRSGRCLKRRMHSFGVHCLGGQRRGAGRQINPRL